MENYEETVNRNHKTLKERLVNFDGEYVFKEWDAGAPDDTISSKDDLYRKLAEGEHSIKDGDVLDGFESLKIIREKNDL